MICLLHKWNGCICLKCGRIRNRLHKCKIDPTFNSEKYIELAKPTKPADPARVLSTNEGKWEGKYNGTCVRCNSVEIYYAWYIKCDCPVNVIRFDYAEDLYEPCTRCENGYLPTSEAKIVYVKL
jgi:hypothetical protein